MLYIEANWQKTKTRIDAIDSIPELTQYIYNIRQLQKHRLDYETSRLLRQSLDHLNLRIQVLSNIAV